MVEQWTVGQCGVCERVCQCSLVSCTVAAGVRAALSEGRCWVGRALQLGGMNVGSDRAAAWLIVRQTP